ncbi:MAG: hypothetical protein Q8L81_07495 [Bacteroidota bacterium]|nr:hypothetical protein [Bacteroidota bacterium]
MKKTFLRCFIISALIIYNFQALKAKSDSVIIRVHFLHGSKPKKQFKHEEDKWFGGILGGHAGIEYETNKIINFQPRSGFHVFAKPKIINSKFSVHDTISFYEILGGQYDSVKKTIIAIKISAWQKNKLDSIVIAYQKRSPYDYAFFGMRCGAAAYDILAQIDVLYKFSFKRTWRKTFYPRKLRRRLEWYAKSRGYKIVKQKGTSRRKWERD